MRRLLILDEFLGVINNNQYTGGSGGSSLGDNQMQFTTNRDGTFAPSVVKSGDVANWVIDGVSYDTNTPSVALTGEEVIVTLTVDDPLNVTRFLATNQDIIGWPKNLRNFTNLQRLYLTGATLNTSIPSWLFDLVNLQQLWLDNTGLTGLISANFEDMTALQLLYLNSNNLTGLIPWEYLPTTLTQLYLNTNDFYGSIEAELSNLTVLQKLRLDFNDITAYEDGAFDISTLTEIRLQDNPNLSQVFVNGILEDFAGYGSRAASGSINLDNTNKPSQDVIDGAVATLTGASWTVTLETVEDVQRYISFETGDLSEAEYHHGDVIFNSAEGDSSASDEVVTDEGYNSNNSLKLTIADAEIDQAGARYIQRWEDNLGDGEPLKSEYFYSTAIKIPIEPVLDTNISDRFVQLMQFKWNYTGGSQAMYSLNLGKPSQSPSPSLLQWYYSIKRPNGLKQYQIYQTSPIAVPIDSWFLMEIRYVVSTDNGTYVNPDGSIEVWQGTEGSMTKIFNITNVYTKYDPDITGRIQYGAGNAYAKGLVTNPFSIYLDDIRIAKLPQHVTSPGTIPTGDANLFQLITKKQGTFNPTVTLSSGTATWIIDEDPYVTNSPSVELDEGTIGTEYVDARISFPDIDDVTQLNLQSQDIVYLEDVSVFTNLQEIRLHSNADLIYALSVLSDISTLSLIYADAVGVTGSIVDFADTSLAYIYLSDTDNTGDISGWSVLTDLVSIELYNIDVTGDIESWNALVNLDTLYLQNTNTTGDISTWDALDPTVIVITGTDHDYLTNTGASSWLNATTINLSDNAFTETELDNLITDIYNEKDNWVAGAKSLNIGGTNASVVDTDIYNKIVDLQDNYSWTITYNLGDLPELLIESGDRLLLESGDTLYLE